MASIASRTCPECGASVAEGVRQCAYCGVWLEMDPTPAPSATSAPGTDSTAPESLQPLRRGVGEFGLRGRAPFVAGVVVVALLYTCLLYTSPSPRDRS